MKNTILTLLIGSSFTFGNSSPVDFTLSGDWASRYVEQGFETTKDSYYTTALEASWENFTAFALYGYAPVQDFQEVNVGLHYTLQIDDFSLTAGYIRYEYLADQGFWNEFDVTFTYDGWEALAPYTTAIYNVELDGYYLELGSSYSYDLTEELSITTYAHVGWSFEYTTDDFNGGNHIQAGVEVGYEVSENLSVYATYNRSFALENLDQAGQKDLNWVNCGFVTTL